MNLAQLPALLSGLALAVGGVAVGFGAFSNTDLQLVVSAVGATAAIVIQIVDQFENRSNLHADLVREQIESNERIALAATGVKPGAAA